MRRRDGNKKRRVERQEQATARQASYDAMSDKQRVALTLNRRGGSERETTRLLDRLDAAGLVQAVRLA